jgi:hypothetical protein
MLEHETRQQLRALANWHQRRARQFMVKAKQAAEHADIHERNAVLLLEALNELESTPSLDFLASGADEDD